MGNQLLILNYCATTGYQGDLGYQDAVDSADAVAKVAACSLGVYSQQKFTAIFDT